MIEAVRYWLLFWGCAVRLELAILTWRIYFYLMLLGEFLFQVDIEEATELFWERMDGRFQKWLKKMERSIIEHEKKERN